MACKRWRGSPTAASYQISSSPISICLAAQRPRGYHAGQAGARKRVARDHPDRRHIHVDLAADQWPELRSFDQAVKADALLGRISVLLSNAAASKSREAPFGPERDKRGTVFVIDDEAEVCEAMRDLLQANGWATETCSSCEAFLRTDHAGRRGCVLVDAIMPGMSGSRAPAALAAIVASPPRHHGHGK
jgi:hypothetical protein